MNFVTDGNYNTSELNGNLILQGINNSTPLGILSSSGITKRIDSNNIYIPSFAHQLFQVNNIVAFVGNEGLGNRVFSIGSIPLKNRPQIQTISNNLFPNPAAEVISIPNFRGLIRVYSALGNLVLQNQTGECGDINVAHLPPGIYTLTAGGQTQRFLKQ